MLVLQFIAQAFMSHEPLVAAAWMGLAVKTDGDGAGGGRHHAIADSGQGGGRGDLLSAGLDAAVTATPKVFIDVFIGVWSFILAYIWTRHINPRAGASKRRLRDLGSDSRGLFSASWRPIPPHPGACAGYDRWARRETSSAAIGEANVLRVIFFTMTFFSIGVMSNFRLKALAGRIQQLAAVYLVSLFRVRRLGRVCHSWLFFASVKPPLAS